MAHMVDKRNVYRSLEGDLNERHHLDDLDGRITLNRILNISMVGCELDIFRQVCFKHRTEPFGSITCGKDRSV